MVKSQGKPAATGLPAERFPWRSQDQRGVELGGAGRSFTVGKPWENHGTTGKTMGKPWENVD